MARSAKPAAPRAAQHSGARPLVPRFLRTMLRPGRAALGPGADHVRRPGDGLATAGRRAWRRPRARRGGARRRRIPSLGAVQPGGAMAARRGGAPASAASRAHDDDRGAGLCDRPGDCGLRHADWTLGSVDLAVATASGDAGAWLASVPGVAIMLLMALTISAMITPHHTAQALLLSGAVTWLSSRWLGRQLRALWITRPRRRPTDMWEAGVGPSQAADAYAFDTTLPAAEPHLPATPIHAPAGAAAAGAAVEIKPAAATSGGPGRRRTPRAPCPRTTPGLPRPLERARAAARTAGSCRP